MPGGMVRMLAGFSLMATLVFAISFFFVAFLVAYLVLRKRAEQAEAPDPQLGYKAALQFFQLITAFFTLTGLVFFFTYIFGKIGKGADSSMLKTSIGMLLGAGMLFVGIELGFRRLTNQAEFGDVRKVFFGQLLAVIGVLGIIGFILFWVGLIDWNGWKGNSFNLPFAAWLVYLPATAGGLLLFRQMYFPAEPTEAGAGFGGGGGGGAGYEAPVAQAQQPGYDQQQPGYDQQQPGYDQQQPGYGQQQPGYGQQQPGYGQQQPGYDQQQPGYGQQQPGYGQQQPGYGQPQQPGYGGGSGGAGLPPPGGYGGGKYGQ